MSAEIERLNEVLDGLNIAYSTLFILTVIVCSMFSYTTIFLLFWRGIVKDVPSLLKICIAGFFFEEIALGYGCVAIIVNEWNWGEFELTAIYKISFTLGSALFLSNHWLFTSHYLKVATMFRLTF